MGRKKIGLGISEQRSRAIAIIVPLMELMITVLLLWDSYRLLGELVDSIAEAVTHSDSANLHLIYRLLAFQGLFMISTIGLRSVSELRNAQGIMGMRILNFSRLHEDAYLQVNYSRGERK